MLAWGNCLGDMSADVAMTKKGFGEMAITGTMAGPIFNVLMGLGVSMTVKFTTGKAKSVSVSIWEDNGKGGTKFHDAALLPLALICGQIVVLIVLLVCALKENFNIKLNYPMINAVIYIIVTTFLVTFSII